MTSPTSDLPCFSENWPEWRTCQAQLSYTHFRLFISKEYFWAAQKHLGSQIFHFKVMPLSHMCQSLVSCWVQIFHAPIHPSGIQKQLQVFDDTYLVAGWEYNISNGKNMSWENLGPTESSHDWAGRTIFGILPKPSWFRGSLWKGTLWAVFSFDSRVVENLLSLSRSRAPGNTEFYCLIPCLSSSLAAYPN